MKKHLLSVVFIFAMLAMLAGCGDVPNEETTATEAPATTETSTTEAATESM